MKFLDRLVGKQRPPEPRLEPESRWTVETLDTAIRVVSDRGETSQVSLDRLRGVFVETNDSGPWGSDVWWILFDLDSETPCAFPQGATGESEAIDRLMKFEGFDHAQMIAAMQSTENATFALWLKEA